MTTSWKKDPTQYQAVAYSAVSRFLWAIGLQPLAELNGPGDAALVSLENLVRRLEIRLGLRKLEIAAVDDLPRDVAVDSYPASVVTEIYEAGVAFSKAVARAYVYFDALQAHRDHDLDLPERKPPGFGDLVESELWEHIEVAYFRAAAFWDRIGQLLEFVFFKIRDYRDGFAVTIKRIKTNFDVDDLPYPPLRTSADWDFLRNFEKREHQELSSKRNLLAHRRGFRKGKEMRSSGDTRIRFVPLSDHLAAAGGKFATAEEELEYVRSHAPTVWQGAAAAVALSLWWLEQRLQ